MASLELLLLTLKILEKTLNAVVKSLWESFKDKTKIFQFVNLFYIVARYFFLECRNINS